MDYQSHHLIPLQAVQIFGASEVLDPSRPDGFCCHDFESNGVWLPCVETEAVRTGKPLHRGPHPRYNELVIDRIAAIVRLGNRFNRQESRRAFFRFRIHLLQSGLRRGLLCNGFTRMQLNRRDPVRTRYDFQDIDKRVDQIWAATKNV